MLRCAQGLRTSQRSEDFGLLDYNARYYSAALGSFVSPDTLVPQPSNMLDWNRYGYVRNNPIRYNDPSGNCIEIEEGFCLREDKNTGGTFIVHAEDGRFANFVKEAIGNFILSGDLNSLNRIPADTPSFMVGASIENACKGLGVDCGDYYNTIFLIITMSILDISNIHYSGMNYNSIPETIHSDVLGDPDCLGCGFTYLTGVVDFKHFTFWISY